MWMREWSALDIVNDRRLWRYDVLVDGETIRQLGWNTDHQDREAAKAELRKKLEAEGLSADKVVPFPQCKRWQVIDA